MREIQSLARGLKILNILAETDGKVSTTSIASELQVDKGSASLLLQTLANYGFAEKDPDTHRYKLGPTIVQLSRSLLTRMPLRETARPFLLQLVQETGECAHLGILSQGKVLYIDQVESPQTLRVNTEVGFTAPLHCTALGKVLLAWGPSDLQIDSQRFTPRTIVEPKVLLSELDKTRSLGYAIDNEEFTPGVRCIAAPVFDFRGKLIGALGISGPAARIPIEGIPEMANQVTSVALELSNRMSFVKTD
jgi:DNA-binding IclR family transcriptional regulator